MGAGSSDNLASLRGRIGALALHAGGGTNTTPARRAFLLRFENEVDPERTLAPRERARRADAARRLYFARLALKSAKSRQNKKSPLLTGKGDGTATGGRSRGNSQNTDICPARQ